MKQSRRGHGHPGKRQPRVAVAETGLIDEYEFIVNPLALGAVGRSFKGFQSGLA